MHKRKSSKVISIVAFVLFTLFSISFNSWSQQNVVTAVEVQGNKKLKPDFIRYILQIKEGKELDSAKIEGDIRFLKRLPAISHAEYQVLPEGKKGYIVHYRIKENMTIIPSINFYTSDNNEFAYRLWIYEFNLFGRAINFGGFYQKDIYNSYAINLRAPFIFGRRLGFTFKHQILSTLEPVFFNNQSAQYKYTNHSNEALLLYQLTPKNRFEFGFNYFKETYEYKNGPTTPEVPESLDVNKLLYKLTYEFNDLNYNYQYIEGFRSLLFFQYVTSYDDALPNFLIGWNDFLFYRRVGDHGNWANRLRLGLASNDETPFAPFSVDNNLNIRGVGNTIDRGTASIVLNSEYRYSLIDKNWFALQANLFIDLGSWRNPGGQLSDIVDSDNIRIFPGIGLRLIHKRIYNAIFRIDYGVGVMKNDSKGFVFGIGQYF